LFAGKEVKEKKINAADSLIFVVKVPFILSLRFVQLSIDKEAENVS